MKRKPEFKTSHKLPPKLGDLRMGPRMVRVDDMTPEQLDHLLGVLGFKLRPPLAEEAPKSAPTPVLGRCRRHAPTMSGYPVVTESDWCGDHKLQSAKRMLPVLDDPWAHKSASMQCTTCMWFVPKVP